jgi:hypothetical protein
VSDIRNLTISLINELKAAHFLKNEAEWDANARHQLTEITARFNGHMETATALTTAFRSKNAEITKSLCDLGVGFRDDNVATIWFNDMIAVFVENSEMLKSYFLFLLKMNGTPL